MTKKEKAAQAKSLKKDTIKFAVSAVPDVLREFILQGLLKYYDECVR